MRVSVTNRPYEVRSHITMDMKLEKKVFDSFMSTLAMMEHGDDKTELSVALTLGELRQHVQWCQYAAASCDAADAANKEASRLRVKAMRADRIVKSYEDQIKQLESIGGAMANLKDKIALFHRTRAEQAQELQRHAQTDD
jgi:hypothetical protein